MNAMGNAATMAVNRFGLGAKPDELAQVGNPRAWLENQIAHGSDTGPLFAALPSSLDYLRETAQLQQARRALRDSVAAQRQ
ncbi:MAG: DUF1800 domain-containing protein, partial [Burkholderiaceae bacterium]